jgi:predicted Rossmann fold flavoprotein
MQKTEIVVVGSGAAGLMAAIAAARRAPGRRVVALDGAARLGAKILIAGGGRCNVTHHAVSERDFNGSTAPAIRRILRAFEVDDTIAFFAAEGVQLKREPTGKLFPVSDQARDVLDALVAAARRSGVELHHPCRVTEVAACTPGSPTDAGPRRFRVGTSSETWEADAVILATGGQSVPKTGSDGTGYRLAEALGLPLTPRRMPALVPLTLPGGHPVTGLSGLATDVTLTVTSGTGRHLREVTGALLCTHQGFSGPAVLDISRHWQAVAQDDPGARLLVCWVPGLAAEDLDRRLQQHGGRPVARALTPLPDRLADLLCRLAGIAPDQSAATLTREARKRLVAVVTHWPAPITGTRGFAVAEVTAGGVPLAALTAELEARTCPGLFVCGELCDVDGRIGGFNFQWAWASGWVAGRAAVSR